jgi:hypothetical protein
MKNRDTNLLAEAYEISYYRNLLLKEGYTIEQLNEINFNDFGRKVRTLGTTAAIAAAGLGSAPKAQATPTIPSTPPAITQTAQQNNPLVKLGKEAKDAFTNSINNRTNGAQAFENFHKLQSQLLSKAASVLGTTPDQVVQRLTNDYNLNKTVYGDLIYLITPGTELQKLSNK